LLQSLIFLGMMLVVLGPVHWYLWKRLVKDTTVPGRWRKAGTILILTFVALFVFAFSAPVRESLPGFLGGDGFSLTLIGYLWLAMVFYLTLILLVLEIPRLFLLPRKVAHATTSAPEASEARQEEKPEAPEKQEVREAQADPAGIERRLLLSRSAAIFAGLTATGIVGYGVKTALGDPVLKRIQIPLAKLPRSLDGYRIALVSDIHLGPLTGVSHAERIVRSINGMDADIVAIVGDLVDGTVEELGDEAAPLAGLRSKDGAFFVTGNHEYYSGAQQWIDEVTRLGIRPLQNERLEIRGLDLAGVNDLTGNQFDEAGGGPDFAKTLGDRDPGKAVVLLAHQPIQASEAAKYKVDLQLSGHTHGGQMVPFNYLARLQQPVISGLGEVDGTKVYVTNGAGFWGPPVRVGAPPDITLVELRAG
jgi:predicted MPP superfamily phosphohydrolase